MPGPERRPLGARRGAAGALGVVLLFSSAAGAYCRTAVCPDGSPGEQCKPARKTDCQIPLYWSKPCFGYSVQQDASAKVDWQTANGVATEAFAAWENVDCDGAGPNMHPVNLGPVACARHEYNQQGGNANVIVFRDADWPYGSSNALALTTVTYQLDTGEIFDADLEINSATIPITTGDVGVQYDLLSIITHEAGHFLGIAHAQDPKATMRTTYVMGETELRSLEADDVAAVCAAYPPADPGPDAGACDPTPRHGFAKDCVDEPPPEEPGCQCAAAGRAGGSPPGALLLGLGALVASARLTRSRLLPVGSSGGRERGGTGKRSSAPEARAAAYSCT
ncbi:MAG: matrixin family metalloprotease [Deltaproteobacteria bacterium]|nr:matrixin family metalloprotease [Deltaproteobacteria bacterium]